MIEYSIFNSPPLFQLRALRAGSRRMRVRYKIIGSATSHIEINFMCQDLRMEFTGFDIEGLGKKEKGTFGGRVLLSVFRILHFSKLMSNAKHETPDFG